MALARSSARPPPQRPGYSEPVTQLTGGDPRFLADSGAADPGVTKALAAFADGAGSEREVLTLLSSARLLVPVVAVRADELAADYQPPSRPHPDLATDGGEKASEMAIPAIVGRDGRRALPAFTGLGTLRRWQPDARPVPVPASGVWQSAVEQQQAVIIDIAGPVPLAVDGARLAALASGQPVLPLHEDPDVHAAVAAAAAGQPAGVRVRLGPPPGDADFALEFVSADPAAGPVLRELADEVAAQVAARLPGRLSRGIALVLHPHPPAAPG